MQTMSGTGACSLAGSFFKKFIPGIDTIYVPNPTWGNHHNIFRQVTQLASPHPAEIVYSPASSREPRSKRRDTPLACHLRAVLPRAEKPQPTINFFFFHLPNSNRLAALNSQVGLPTTLYNYLDDDATGFDCDGMLQSIEEAPDGSVFLL